MNCEHAKELIDRKLHELWGKGVKSPETSPVHDWSPLDAHMRTCPRCASEYEGLRESQRVLTGLSADRPTNEEINKMWNAIQIHAGAVAARKPYTRRARLWTFSVSGLAAAALLLFAFQLGSMRYGKTPLFTGWFGSRTSPFGEVNAGLTLAPAGEFGRNERLKQSARVSAPYAGAGPQFSPAWSDDDRTQGQTPADTLAGSYDFTQNENISYGYGVPTADTPQSVSSPAPLPPPAVEPLFAEQKLEKGATDKGAAKTIIRAGVPGRRDLDGRMVASQEHKTDEGAPASPAWQSVPAKEPQQSSPPQKAAQLKIIKTGDLAVEVSNYNKAVAQIERLIPQFGAFIADAVTREETGGALTGRIVIRVAPESFESLFAALKSIGRVESEDVKSADVTAEYVDLEARIHSLQITEERLHDLVKNKSIVDKVSALLEVERELGRVRSDIETMQGQLRVMGDRIALSTITMSIREPARTVPSASLSVEVATLDEASAALGEALARVGGQLLSGKTAKRNDGTLMGTYQVQSSLADFGTVLADIEKLGRVEERQVKDRQFSEVNEPWAKDVKCSLALTFFERSRQLPTGSVRQEIDSLEPAIKKLDELLAEAGASLVNNKSTKQPDGSTVAELKIRVPAGRFADLLDALTPLGRTIARNVAGEAGSIVGGAAAVPCELNLTMAEKPRQVPQGTMSVQVAAFPAARSELTSLVEEKGVQVLHSASMQRTDGTWTGRFQLAIKAADMEAVVTRLEKLGRIESREIKGLGLGDLSRVDPDALGTVELTLAEKPTISPASVQTTGTVRAALRDGLAGLYSSVGMILYGLTVLAPWLVIAVLFGVLVARFRARRTPRPTVSAS